MSDQQKQTNRRPDPDAYYSPRDVLLTWDVSLDVQARARDAGTLEFTGTARDAVLYTGAALQRWFDAGMPAPSREAARAVQRARSRGTGTASAGGSSVASALGGVTVLTGRMAPAGSRGESMKGITMTSATTEFWQRVNRKINAGVDRMTAVRETVKADPELHRRMLSEANRGRPHALRAIEGRAARGR